MAADGIGTQQWIRQRPANVVSGQETATHFDLILPVASLGLMPVVGSDGDEPSFPELLVTLSNGLDQVTGEFVNVTHSLPVLLRFRPKGVPGVVDPLEVDDGGVRAFVQQVPGGPRRHLFIGPIDALRQVGAKELVLAGALLVMIGLAVNVWGGWLFGRLRLVRV